jgi:hypothetical protein
MKNIIICLLMANKCLQLFSQKELTVVAVKPFSGNDCIDFLFLD